MHTFEYVFKYKALHECDRSERSVIVMNFLCGFSVCIVYTERCVLCAAGKKVVDVAVGSTHCLVLTEDGEVHSWGSNDKLQHFDTLFSNKKQPKALPGLKAKHIVGVACGPEQVTARRIGSCV